MGVLKTQEEIGENKFKNNNTNINIKKKIIALKISVLS